MASSRSRWAAWATTAAPWSPASCSGCFSKPRIFWSAASSPRSRSSPSSSSCCWRVPKASPAPPCSAAFDGYADGKSAPEPCRRARANGALGMVLPFLALFVFGIALPLFGGGYWGVIATRACVYWVLVSGLNLVVGFAGQLAIGWVSLLTLGAYTTSVLAAGNATPALPPYVALAIAAVVGAVFGVIIGLPALRLRTFYFAITTLGFAT